MKVHLICPVFPPESVASAVMAQHIAQGLVREGHEVTVITSFPSKMKGEIFPGYRRTLRQVETAPEGYRLCRVFTFFSKESTLLSRLPENLSFALASNAASVLLGHPDVMYMNTWAIFSSLLTGAACTLRGIPFVYNVQDLYPETAAGLGHVPRGGVLYRLLEKMDSFTMARAARIVPISEEFAQVIHRTRGVPLEKIAVVWNWYDACVVPGEKAGELRTRFALHEDGFVVMYAGNVGSVAGLETVLAAAQILGAAGDNTRFVLAGDGTLREGLEDRCRREGIGNVHFHYPLHRQDLGRVQAAADVMLITAKRGLALSEVPSKIMAYMLSGRPVLAMVDELSNTARLVKMADCGLVGPPEDPEALARLVVEMRRSGRLASWGRNARAFALEHFDQAKAVSKVMDVITEVANGHANSVAFDRS